MLGAGGTGAWAWQDGRTRGGPGEDGAGSALAAAVLDADSAQVAGLSAQAARSAAQGLADQSRSDLQQTVTAARGVLDASAGKVPDDAVRTALAATLAQADAALTGIVAPARAAALAASVSAAATQVTQAQTTWQAAQDAVAQAAAAQAAAKAAAKPRATSSAAPAPSVDPCRTTYDGPLFWTSVPAASGDGSNGHLPASSMTPLSWTTDSHGTRFYLLTPAAQALERLNVAFRAAFGHGLDIDLAYRDYDTQVAMRAALGTVAAVPGTSPHGFGKAIDVPELPCEYGWTSPQRAWLLAHGPSFGWVQPAWALQNGSGPEYWHYEYVG